MAAAADPMPTPDCHGQQAVDPTGDSVESNTGQAGVPSSDLTGAWVTYDPASGKAQANIQVANLTLGEMDAGYDGISWSLTFTAPKKTFEMRAFSDITGTTKYTWSEPRAVTDDQTAERLTGETTGKQFPGQGGVIQIDIPLKDMSINPGESLKAITLEVRQWVTKPASVPSPPSQVPLYSYAPIYDSGAGKGSVFLGACETPAPSSGETPAPAPGTPGATGTPGSGSTPPAPSSGRLELKVKVPTIVAKKANKAKKKGLAFKLSGTATNIAAVLKTGTNPMQGKVVASGKLASVKGSGTLKLKLKGKLKKGTYTLYLTGKNANGSNGEGAVTVKVK